MDAPDWLFINEAGQPTVLNMLNGAPSQFLIPLADTSALLWWQFDEDVDDSQVCLLVHLTDAEAQLVFDSPWTEGMLESVRGLLSDKDAVVLKKSGVRATWSAIAIPAEVSEDQFLDLLFDVADSLGRDYDKSPPMVGAIDRAVLSIG